LLKLLILVHVRSIVSCKLYAPTYQTVSINIYFKLASTYFARSMEFIIL